jgi:tripartite-type tricarboxylate transporter receptor subunit TctC
MILRLLCRAPAALLAFAVALSAAPAAEAVTFPTRAVRILVPYSVGLGPDVVMRTVADALSRAWKQPVIIENRPGASGMIALAEVKRAPPDGHTLFLGDAGSLAMSPYLQAQLPYDPVRDFAPITTIFRAIFVVWTATDARFTDMQDLLREARAKKSAVSFASLGSAHPSQTAMETFASRAGIELLHVPFKDGAQMLAAVANRDVDVTALSYNSAAGMVQAGRLRPLAVGRGARLKDHPEIPTLREAGVPAVDMTPWAALLGVAGTPQDVLDQIHRDVTAALRDPAVRGKIETLGFEVLGSTPKELAAIVRSERENFDALVRAGKIKAE